MAAEFRRHLPPGAPSVVVPLSVADVIDAEGEAGEREHWLSRYAAFQVASGVAPQHAAKVRDKIAAELTVLTLEEGEPFFARPG